MKLALNQKGRHLQIVSKFIQSHQIHKSPFLRMSAPWYFIHPPKFNSSPLKKDTWKTLAFSFGMLVNFQWLHLTSGVAFLLNYRMFQKFLSTQTIFGRFFSTSEFSCLAGDSHRPFGRIPWRPRYWCWQEVHWRPWLDWWLRRLETSAWCCQTTTPTNEISRLLKTNKISRTSFNMFNP